MSVRAIVVGGTNGIGWSMANAIAARSESSVIISGRTKPKNIPYANMEFRPLDASSMRQIKAYTNNIKSAQDQKLDFLIMTQSYMSLEGRDETPEGIDRKMALHYYGRQLLIRELAPVLKDDGKVIIVYDGKFGSPKNVDWDNLDLKTNHTMGKAANHGMVMNDVMIQHHAAQQQGTHKRHFVHAFPGGVHTNLASGLPWYVRYPYKAIGPLVLVSSDTCAKYLLEGTAKCTEAGEKEGRYWSNIDNKGRLISGKTIWTEDRMKQVAEHTWGLVDKALESGN